MHGWLYIIKNESLAGVIKIGRTDDSPEVLTQKLDMSGAAPTAFQLPYKVYVCESYMILQNVRKVLWALQKNVGSGWFHIDEEEGIGHIRNEIALHIIDRLRMEIQMGHGHKDFDTTMRIIDNVLFLKENIRNSIDEVKEIAQNVAGIMEYSNWMHDGTWVNRLTGGNSRYTRSNKYC